MEFKKIIAQLNIPAQCRRYGLSLWQCPQFLFLMMGIVIIIAAIAVYTIGTRYLAEPEVVALIVLIISAVLFVIANIITNSFERLAEASRMKSEFISIVSHQLRSPLTNLKWTTDLLISGRTDGFTKKQSEYFTNLKENIARMGKLVNDLLIVSRLESATLSLKKKEFSLLELVKEVVKEFESFAEASNVEIKFKTQKNLPKIFTDPSQIKQVIENLLDNAIRYIKNKGEVKINLERRGKDLYFEIKDSGVGIPKNDQKYIFQKFFRSENVLHRQTQGSGLGLYISKSIIGRLGGKVGFKSQESVGSTFWFTLPIK